MRELNDKERLIRQCLLSYGGLQAVSAMRDLFCETACPSNELSAAYMQGRNSIILALYELMETKED